LVLTLRDGQIFCIILSSYRCDDDDDDDFILQPIGIRQQKKLYITKRSLFISILFIVDLIFYYSNKWKSGFTARLLVSQAINRIYYL